MTISRKTFLKTISGALMGLSHGVLGYAARNTVTRLKREMIFGWTTCLTYETGERKLGFEYFSRLLDEMSNHGMSRLLVMMESSGYFSPLNHGLAWPVRNQKLLLQLDRKALNAHEETEFFSRIIDKAHSLGISVFIEIKYLGLIGVKEGYPGIEFLRKSDGQIIHTIRPEADAYEREAIATLHICCDSPQTRQYMRDKIADVLTRYAKLDGIVLEHPSYTADTCFCRCSKEKLLQETGKQMENISKEELLKWKSKRIKETLQDFKSLIKSINPQMQFGFYSGFSPLNGTIDEFQSNRGQTIEALKEVGFDFIMPYSEGRHQDQETQEMERVIDYLSPLPCYMHTVVRRDSPHNYQLPPKGPEYIKKIIAWGRRYHEQNRRLTGMTFFNEVKIPEENRLAVYDGIE
jgi:hypothetical protein